MVCSKRRYVTVFMFTSWFTGPVSAGSEASPTHLSNALKPESFTEADAQLTVVDFKSHAGDLLRYYHHGPGERHHT